MLGRFFGPHEALRRRVKKLIVAVNHNTCEHLEALIAGIPRLVTPQDQADFTAEMRARVLADNQSFGRRVKDLLDEIRCAPERPARSKRASGWMQAAASAGLVATVTLAATACKEKSHPTEMVAIPTTTTSGPPPGDTGAVASPSGDAELAAPPSGPAALIKPSVGKQLLPLLRQEVVPAADVELELWVAADGSVSKAVLNHPTLTPAAEKAILEEARKMTFPDAIVRGQRFIVAFSRDELTNTASADAGVIPPPVPTHMKERVPRPEMAPRPPPPRPEMAPRPPTKPPKPGSAF